MDIDQQIQALIDHAPQDGMTPTVVEAIAPALKLIAGQLKHSQYYILQTLEQNWVMTTISHRTQPELEKKVIYAYPTLKDVAAGPSATKDPQVVALPVPITHILFQMVAMSNIDSAVFFETPGNVATGTEVSRKQVHSLIQLHLQKARGISSLPPDVA